MDSSLLAQRYARALYEFAEKEKQDRAIAQEMKLLAAVWHQVPELKKALESPLPDTVKMNLLLNAVGSGKRLDVITRFFTLVAHHHRLFLLGRMARAYVELWNARHNIVRADLITVGEVGTELSKQLEELVQKAVGTKKVEFSRSYNPDMIGGFIMQVEDLRIDASVRRELDYIKMNLLQ
ncbi:MAG: ATP synthase F1 subunit delta [Bacteroidales bacterium]